MFSISQGRISLLLFAIFIAVVAIILVINSIIRSKNTVETEDKEEIDKSYDDDFVNSKGLLYKICSNKLIYRVGAKGFNSSELVKLFNDSKNPWGITPIMFRSLRLASLIIGAIASVLLFAFFPSLTIWPFGIIFGLIGWWYPKYYYKAIAKERELEWNKIYEFIWVLKRTSILYDPKKVFLETRNYIAKTQPHYKELIQGMEDFYNYWDDYKIDDYIVKHYSFSIPKELFNIMFNLAQTGVSADQNLDNLRAYALNKHNGIIQNTLSTVASKATIASLPFMMLSVVVVLIVPMIWQFVGYMT